MHNDYDRKSDYDIATVKTLFSSPERASVAPHKKDTNAKSLNSAPLAHEPIR
jgi:hypothetical protein